DTVAGPDTEELPAPDTEPLPGPDTIEAQPDIEPVCEPDCAGKQCGDNGCGGSCGECVGADACVITSCADGQCVGTAKNCDDGNLCTDDSCDSDTGDCNHTTVDCNDENACTVDSCDTETGCVSTAISCDDGNLCTDDSCVLATGCVYYAVDCDDGDIFTTDSCDPATGCESVFTGECQSDLDCDDGDECTEEECDLATAMCAGAPVTCDDDSACTVDSCEPSKGCAHTDTSADCDDEDPMTMDFCQPKVGCQYLFFGTGPCKSDSDCDNSDLCLAVGCNTVTGQCEYESLVCDDGDECTVDSCDSDKGCVGMTVVCNDNNLCTVDSCDKDKGCFYIYNSAPCNDGNPYTTVDTCVSGACVGSGTVECLNDAGCPDDGNACNGTAKCIDDSCEQVGAVVCEPSTSLCQTTSCNPATGACEVKSANQGGACDDNTACTIGDACQGGKCLGAAIACDDQNPCTTDSCDAGKGCQHANNTAACNDGNDCTVGDVCQSGACVSGSSVCECQADAECADYEDNNLCNGTLVCKKTKCAVDPMTVVFCDSSEDTACAKSVCDPGSGECKLVPANAGLGCSDNNACTSGDICSGKQCVGTTLSCNDGNICTTDSCDAGKGCQHANNTAACNDGNAITVDDVCKDGVCSGKLVPKQCEYDSHCSDGKACNGAEKCISNQCYGGVAPNCSDIISCTVDTCVENSYYWDGYYCSHKADDTFCSKGQMCVSDAWGPSGCTVCTDAYDCDDKNPCTSDSCQFSAGYGTPGKCVHTNNTAVCNDNNACTSLDVCKDSKCVGSAATCNDNNECTVDSCDPAVGCKYAGFTGGGNISCGVGACAVTINKCLAGVKQTCIAKTPVVEVCANGLDDNCDGAVDEGCTPPPPLPPTFKVEVSCSAGACEPWIFHTADAPGEPVVTLGSGPLAATLTQKQACGDWGFEVAVRDKTVATWPWYGCDSSISLTTVTVKVNGVVKSGVLTKHLWACQGGGEGNLAFSKTLIGCP
ncbi:MAG: Extracellular matrix protein, partial [Candidatus Magasanikbacteria bacterium GW2011_GWA2_42_32]